MDDPPSHELTSGANTPTNADTAIYKTSGTNQRHKDDDDLEDDPDQYMQDDLPEAGAPVQLGPAAPVRRPRGGGRSGQRAPMTGEMEGPTRTRRRLRPVFAS